MTPMNRLTALVICISLIAGPVVSANGTARTSSDSAAIDLSGAKGENLFFVLGMLDENSGRRFREDSDRIESFYCNERFHARVFLAYLEIVARDQGITDPVRTDTKQSCLISLYARSLSSLINSFYTYEYLSRSRLETDDGRKQHGYAWLPAMHFEQAREQLKYAYLAGVYFRYGEEHRLRLDNSSKKTRLIARLLEDVGCDSVTTSSRAGIPATNQVLFRQSSELLAWFERYPAPWAMDRADTLVGLASPDEIQVYSEILDAAEAGAFDGCVLNKPYALSRETFLMDPPKIVLDDLPDRFVDALFDFETRNDAGESVSLRELEGRALLLHKVIDLGDTCQVAFSSVGFSPDGNAAATLFTNFCAGPNDCQPPVVVFLEKRGLAWDITYYSVKQPRRPINRKKISPR